MQQIFTSFVLFIQRIKKHGKTLAKIVFAAALIYWMVHKDALDFEAFSALASPGVIGFCVLCVFVQIFACNIRWLKLMQGQGFQTSIRHTLPLSLIGLFFNFAMPGGVGGDVIKGYYLFKDYPKQKFVGAISIFMDRMMGFFIMIATAFVALFFNWSAVSHSPPLQSVAWGVGFFFVGFLVFFFLSLSKVLQHPKLSHLLFEVLPGGAKLRALYETLHTYRRAPEALLWAAAMSVVNQLGLVAVVFVVGQAMGMTDIPLGIYFFLVPVGTVVQALPISPAGIGVGQAAFFFLFNMYLGKESQVGPTAVTTIQLISFFWGLFGAYFYLRRSRHETKSISTEMEEALAMVPDQDRR